MGQSSSDSIRPAGPADLEAILRIEEAAFEPSRRASRASLARALRSQFQRVLVFEHRETVAGYLVLWPYRHTWRIYNLATDPGHRNRGVAGTLLAAAAAAARDQGARRMVLESRASPELVGYYRARGFRVERRLADYYAPGEDAVRMVMEFGDPSH